MALLVPKFREVWPARKTYATKLAPTEGSAGPFAGLNGKTCKNVQIFIRPLWFRLLYHPDPGTVVVQFAD